MAIERQYKKSINMNNDSTIYNDFGTETRQPESTAEEQSYEINTELLAILDELSELFPEEVQRIKDHGVNIYGEGGFKFIVQEYVDYGYQYNIMVNVFHDGRLIIPDMSFTFPEITNARKEYTDFTRLIKKAVPIHTAREIEGITANFSTALRTDKYYIETAKQWGHIKNYRFKDRTNPKRFENLQDAIRCADGHPFKNDDGSLAKTELAYFLTEKFSLKVLVLKDGKKAKQVYYFDRKQGVYKKNGEDIVNSEMISILGDDSSIALKHEIMNIIIGDRSLWMKPDEFQPSDPYEINLKNGLYHVKTRELKPHSPKHLSTVQYDVEYNENAKSVWFDKFIEGVLPDETDRRDVLEFFSYTLLPHLNNCYHKSLMLLGPPGTGKGTLLDSLQQLLDETNVSTSDLQKIESNIFQAFQLYEKVANISDDLPKESMADCPNFKTITTGGRINVQDKNKSAFDTRIYAKLISAANNLPYAPTEGNDAYFQRFVIVRMNRKFRGTKEQIPNLIQKLSTPEEKSHMLNVLLQHLDTVIENDCLSYNKTLEEIKRLYELEQNHLAKFFEECTQESSSHTPKEDVFEAYTRWCETNNIADPKASSTALTTAVHKSKFTLNHIKGGQCREEPYRDVMVWFNLELRHPWSIKGGKSSQQENPEHQFPPKLPNCSVLVRRTNDEPLHDYN